MIKVYEIKGVVECSRVFRLGKLCARCDFSGGAVNETGIVPAVYSTNNPVTQAVIENSEHFKQGRIVVQSVITEPSDEMEDRLANKQALKTPKSELDKGKGYDFPDVKNSQMAKDILMAEPYNVSLAELANKTAIQAKAAELNITFSNWN